MNLPVYSRGSKVAKEWCRECSRFHGKRPCQKVLAAKEFVRLVTQVKKALGQF